MSTQLIYDRKDELLAWARERIGIAAFRPDAQAIGLERDGALVAVVVFDDFSDVDCHIHIASDGTRRWLNRDLLRATFAYVFVQLRLLRVTGMVDEANQAALAFDEHIGFVREGYHPLAGDDGRAMWSLGLTRPKCRYIPDEFRTMRNT